jgi:hypothetical protein
MTDGDRGYVVTSGYPENLVICSECKIATPESSWVADGEGYLNCPTCGEDISASSACIMISYIGSDIITKIQHKFNWFFETQLKLAVPEDVQLLGVCLIPRELRGVSTTEYHSNSTHAVRLVYQLKHDGNVYHFCNEIWVRIVGTRVVILSDFYDTLPILASKSVTEREAILIATEYPGTAYQKCEED